MEQIQEIGQEAKSFRKKKKRQWELDAKWVREIAVH